MNPQPNDALLKTGLIMTIALMGLTLVVTAILIGLMPVTVFMPEWLIDDAPLSGSALAAALTLLATMAAITATAFYFFKLLNQLIKSVGDGSPFTIENADRLTQMAWIALIFQVTALPIGLLAAYLAHSIPTGNLTIDYEFSLTGLLLAVVLFILARVFRHGADMREDLEGTV